MAHLDIEQDMFTPGRWAIRSDQPSALAAASDAVVQVLELDGEALAAWALHPDEQDGARAIAYEDERRELGQRAIVQVAELPRPRQVNVVWVDRYHLLASSASPTVGSRLLGLYVGSKGRVVMGVHHPSVTGTVNAAFGAMPGDDGHGWDAPQLLGQCRFVVRYEPTAPDVLQVRAPQAMAQGVHQALAQLAGAVAGW